MSEPKIENPRGQEPKIENQEATKPRAHEAKKPRVKSHESRFKKPRCQEAKMPRVPHMKHAKKICEALGILKKQRSSRMTHLKEKMESLRYLLSIGHKDYSGIDLNWNLDNTNLSYACLDDADLTFCGLCEVNFEHSFLLNVNLSYCDMKSANMMCVK